MALRTSYSSRELLHSCERKYQLTKLVGPKPAREEREYFSHGHGFGSGVASYMLYGDKDKAIYDCWIAYWPIIDTEEYNAYICCALLRMAFFKLDELRRDWEVATFNGKPAIELSARININPEIYDVAFIDVVLKHKQTGMYAVLECKSTSARWNDIEPMYKNSSQTIGYSVILDAVAGAELASFQTIHFVGQMKGKLLTDVVFHTLPYIRTLRDRLDWFITLGMDIQRLQQMIELKYFPMRGGHCQSFGRPCQYFGTCQFRKSDVPRIEEPDTNVYDFEFMLNDIVSDHVKRIEENLL